MGENSTKLIRSNPFLCFPQFPFHLVVVQRMSLLLREALKSVLEERSYANYTLCSLASWKLSSWLPCLHEKLKSTTTPWILRILSTHLSISPDIDGLPLIRQSSRSIILRGAITQHGRPSIWNLQEVSLPLFLTVGYFNFLNLPRNVFFSCYSCCCCVL